MGCIFFATRLILNDASDASAETILTFDIASTLNPIPTLPREMVIACRG